MFIDNSLINNAEFVNQHRHSELTYLEQQLLNRLEESADEVIELEFKIEELEYDEE